MERDLDRIAEGDADEVKTLREFWDTFTPLLDEAYEKMEKIKPEEVGENCPDCGSPLVYRLGRFGKFISCSGFPRCRYTRQIDGKEKEKPEPTGKTCPECGGELLKRKSRYGTYFHGCSNFPKCRYMESLDGERIVSRSSSARTSRSTGRKTVKRTTRKSSKA